MKKIFRLFTVVIAISFIISCKHTVEPQPAAANGTLELHLHTNVDTNEVDSYNTSYTITGGDKISVDSAQLYISNIQLVRSDNSIYSVPNTIILQVQDEETYLVGEVPAGNYKSIRFSVGLNPLTNQKVPSNSADDVLNSPEMWFGSSAQPNGYVFVNFKGTIDTSTITASAPLPFSYKIGTDANYTQVSMPDQNYTITPGQTQIIHMVTDYNELLKNVPLDISNRMIISQIDNSKPIMTTIKTNIPLMFKYEIE